jgi:hypothetical protein
MADVVEEVRPTSTEVRHELLPPPPSLPVLSLDDDADDGGGGVAILVCITVHM